MALRTRQVRFLLVAPRFHTNQVWAIRALREAGHQVHFLALYRGATEDYRDVEPSLVRLGLVGRTLVAWGRRTRDFMTAMQIFGVPDLWHLWKYLRQVNPDVIIVRDPTLPVSLACLMLGRLLGKKLIIYTQGTLSLRSRRKEAIRSLLIKFFNAAWMTPVRAPEDNLRAPHPRVFYVPFVAPRVDLARPPQSGAAESPGAVRVLTIGKFEPRKNHLLLLDALQPYLESRQAVLTIVGEVSTDSRRQQFEKVRAAVTAKGLDEAVRFRINVPFHEIPAVYHGADLFVLPSRDEPAAVSLLEAMAYGLPAICSTTNGTRCYLVEGVNGYVFESDNMASLREKLGRVVTDRTKLQKMSAAAAEIVLAEFSAEAYLRRMDRIVQTLGLETGQPPTATAQLPQKLSV